MIVLPDPLYWVDQLKINCSIFDQRVFETVENDNAALDFYEAPLALVYVSEDSSEPNQMLNIINQKHDVVMSVKLAIRKTINKKDRLNAHDSRLIRLIRMEVMNALIGWIPSDCDNPVEHISGELQIKDDLLLWVDKFTTFNYLRVE